MGKIRNMFRMSEDAYAYKFDVFAYTNDDDQRIEVCRFVTAMLRNWLDKEDKERFLKKRPVSVKLPEGAKNPNQCFIPVLVQENKQGNGYIYIWHASKGASKMERPALGSFIVSGRSIVFDGLIEDQDIRRDFMKLFDECYLVYFPPKKTGMPSTECSERVAAKTEELQKMIDSFRKKPSYAEKKEEYDQKIAEILKSFTRAIARTDAAVQYNAVDYAYSVMYDEQAPEEYLVKFGLRMLPKVDRELMEKLDAVVDEYYPAKREAAKAEALREEARARVEQEMADKEARDQLLREKAEQKVQASEEKRKQKEYEAEIRAELKGKSSDRPQSDSKPKKGPSTKGKPKKGPGAQPQSAGFTGQQIVNNLLCKGVKISEIPKPFRENPNKIFSSQEIKKIMGNRPGYPV